MIENPIKIDDLGVPLFRETTICPPNPPNMSGHRAIPRNFIGQRGASARAGTAAATAGEAVDDPGGKDAWGFKWSQKHENHATCE